MPKKKHFDEESEDFINEESIEENVVYLSDEEEDLVSEDISVVISEDDEDKIDIVIELSDDDDEDLDIVEIKDDDIDPIGEEEVVLSKHKIQGKHSLKYDSIFKGKKEDAVEEDTSSTSSFFNDKFEVDKTSSFYSESHDNELYLRQKKIKERVYEILSNKTNLNFLNNRRKPSRIDFNNYYTLLTEELVIDRFTNVELFNELAVYFSDNLFNMFKLLDNKWRNLIINELQDHIGKNSSSKEITNRNIYLGTEIEFNHQDILGEVKLFTGVVVDADYQNSLFKIDSYENIYEIDISSIVKILNNTKFKHNLNKLDNIDFL